MNAPGPKIGEILGERYRLDAALGAGGMGSVFAASHVLTSKSVAIKWVAAEGVLPTNETWQRFLREARIASSVRHPNVVEVHDIGEGANGFYLVMELLRGCSLAELLEKENLPLHEIVRLLVPVLRGMGTLHRRGIVHRDVKTSNIFVCRNEDGTISGAKILDFGISKVPEEGSFRLTKTGAVMGSPRFMSPEQLKDVRYVDARSDVYSFGVVLQTALTGKHPFDATTPGTIATAVANGGRPRARDVNPQVSPELEAVLERALSIDPAERYADADALADALEPFTVAERACASAGVAGPVRSVSPPADESTRAVRPVHAPTRALGSAWSETPSKAPPPGPESHRPPRIQSAPPPAKRPAPRPARVGAHAEAPAESSMLGRAPLWIGLALVAVAIGAGAAAAFIKLRSSATEANRDAASAPAAPSREPARAPAIAPSTSLTVEAEPAEKAHEAAHPTAHVPHHHASTAAAPEGATDPTSLRAGEPPAPGTTGPAMLDDPWAEDSTGSAEAPAEGEAEAPAAPAPP